MDYLYYVFGILTFIAVVLLIEGLYLSWNATRGPEAERVARRLRLMSAGAHGERQTSTLIKQRLLSGSPALHRFLLQLPRVRQLDRILEQSGLSWSVARFAGTSLAALILGWGAALWLRLPLAAGLLLGLMLAAIPLLRVLHAKGRRLARIGAQLPDALDLIGRAMRAGHAFPTALKMAGDEMSEPIATEFRATFDEVNFGIAMNDALLNLATRVPMTDLRYFVIAAMIQRETGGNLGELLDNISAIVRARMKLLGHVRVLSAEGRMSAWVLSMLPFGTAALIWITNPEYLAVLVTDPSGKRMALTCLTMMGLGALVMRKIIRIRV